MRRFGEVRPSGYNQWTSDFIQNEIKKWFTASNMQAYVGPAGEMGPIGLTGLQGDPGVPTSMSSTVPARAFNTNFTPNGSKGTWLCYTVSISSNLTLTGGQTGSVSLLSDLSSTPTTERARISNGNSGTLVIGIAITNLQVGTICYLCPPGHNVRLVNTGTATVSIVAQNEVEIS